MNIKLIKIAIICGFFGLLPPFSSVNAQVTSVNQLPDRSPIDLAYEASRNTSLPVDPGNPCPELGLIREACESGLVDNAQFDNAQSVPEPSSLLAVLAIGGLGLGLKRKKQSDL